MRTTALIIAAAGQGSRMGANMNKQFIELDGQAILAHTLMRFKDFDEIGQVIVLHHEDEKVEMECILNGLTLPFEITYVIGGKSRQESVYNGLMALDRHIEKVMIHDGARPFVTDGMMKTMKGFLDKLSMSGITDGGFFGVPLKDTIKQKTDKGFVTIDRSTLHAVQTPQIFKKEILIKAHEQALEEEFVGTDDCSLVERIGGHIEVISGDYRNIKVTTPEDLVIAEVFLKLV